MLNRNCYWFENELHMHLDKVNMLEQGLKMDFYLKSKKLHIQLHYINTKYFFIFCLWNLLIGKKG